VVNSIAPLNKTTANKEIGSVTRSFFTFHHLPSLSRFKDVTKALSMKQMHQRLMKISPNFKKDARQRWLFRWISRSNSVFLDESAHSVAKFGSANPINHYRSGRQIKKYKPRIRIFSKRKTCPSLWVCLVSTGKVYSPAPIAVDQFLSYK